MLHEKEGSKTEHGPTFCFDFWVRFGDHRALYHIPIVIIPTLAIILDLKKEVNSALGSPAYWLNTKRLTN